MKSTPYILPLVTAQATRGATEAATGPAVSPVAQWFATAVLGIGVCVLVAWAFIRLRNPRKLLLAGAPGRPNRLTPLHIVALTLAYLLIGSVCGVLAAALLGGGADESSGSTPALLTAGLMTDFVLAAVVLIVAARTFRHGIARGLGLTGRRWFVDTVRAGVAILAVFPVCVALLMLAQWLLPEWLHHRHDVLRFLSREAMLGWKALAVFTAVIAAPIAEELLFRGMVQSALVSLLGGRWRAVLVCSALFAAMHLGVSPGEGRVVGWENLPPLFALSVVLGYNYERTGRLWAPMVIHSLFNGINITVQLLSG